MVIKAHIIPSRINAFGLAHIQIYVNIKQSRFFLPTEIFIKPAEFDNKNGSIKTKLYSGPKRALIDLPEKINEVQSVIDILKRKKISITKENIFAELNSNTSTTLYSEFFKQKYQLACKKMGEKQAKLDKTAYACFVAYAIDIELSQIDQNFVQGYLNWLYRQKNKRTDRPFSAFTVKNYFVSFKKYVTMAMDDELILKNPFQHIHIKKPSANKQFLMPDEIRVLHAGLLDDELEFYHAKTLYYYLCGCYTGMRYQTLRIFEKYIRGNYILVNAKKSDKDLVIPISSRLRELLEWKKEQSWANQKITISGRGNSYLKDLAKKYGINKDLSWHTSRHTFAVNARMLGIDLKTVQDILGHSDIKTTQIYDHIVQQYNDEQMMKWNNL